VSRRVPSEVLQRFRRVPLFSMLSSRALRLIVDAAREHDLPAGTLLVREGDRDRDLYVVMRGEARVMRGGAVITTLGVGDFFGEFALLADEPRSATVIAGTDVRVMVLSAPGLQEALRREPLLVARMEASRERRLKMVERSTAL